MGMGAQASAGWKITAEHLKKLCPTEYNNLIDFLEKHNLNLDTIAQDIQLENDFDQSEAFYNVLDALQIAFSNKTIPGDETLELELFYYNSDDGDIYDDLTDGANWLVHNVEVMTPSAKQIADYLERALWTTFG